MSKRATSPRSSRHGSTIGCAGLLAVGLIAAAGNQAYESTWYRSSLTAIPATIPAAALDAATEVDTPAQPEAGARSETANATTPGNAAVATAGTTAVRPGPADSDHGGDGGDAESPSGPAPASLAPPAGQVEVAGFRASGVQVYQCTAGAWTFLEPAASLQGWSRRPARPQAAVHFRGPSWESTTDGSLVEAKAVASVPVTGSVAQLLLQATRNRGTGLFGNVTYIQRLSTSGGAMPSAGCTTGATVGVPYRAEYRFFALSSTK